MVCRLNVQLVNPTVGREAENCGYPKSPKAMRKMAADCGETGCIPARMTLSTRLPLPSWTRVAFECRPSATIEVDKSEIPLALAVGVRVRESHGHPQQAHHLGRDGDLHILEAFVYAPYLVRPIRYGGAQ